MIISFGWCEAGGEYNENIVTFFNPDDESGTNDR